LRFSSKFNAQIIPASFVHDAPPSNVPAGHLEPAKPVVQESEKRTSDRVSAFQLPIPSTGNETQAGHDNYVDKIIMFEP